MEDVRDLLDRYLDQRESLDEQDIARLAAAVRQSPDMARALKAQLVMDDLLGQQLAIDRQGFSAQVEQRLHDFQCGQQRLDEQTAQLRRLAEVQLSEMAAAIARRRYRWVITLAATLLIAVGTSYGYWNSRYWRPVATIRSVQGDVQWLPAGSTVGAPTQPQVAQQLMHGDRVILAEGAEMRIQYADGTRLDVSAGSRVTFRWGGWRFLKGVYLEHGRITAKVAPQVWHGAMTFETPVAVARVVGTELTLRASTGATRLDVFEGQVELRRTVDGRTAQVMANQVGLASADDLTVKPAQWPLFRDGLIARLDSDGDAAARLILPMRGDAALPVAPQGLAWLGRDDRLVFSGGGFLASDPEHQLSAAIQRTGEWTLELVVQPKSTSIESVLGWEAMDADGPLPPSQAEDLSPAAQRLAATKLVELSDGKSTAFALRQFGASLRAVWTTADQQTEFEVAQLATGRPYHVTVRYRGGRLIATVDKLITLATDIEIDVNDWRIERVMLGAVAGQDSPWYGMLSHLAIYNRSLSDHDVLRQAELAMRAARSPAAFRMLVRAVPTSPAWTALAGATDLAPSLLVREFRAMDTRLGTLPSPRFVAAYWDVVDSHHAALASEAESQRTFVLERLGEYPHVGRLVALAARAKEDAVVPDFFVVEWQ
jgi:hypothetical protein